MHEKQSLTLAAPPTRAFLPACLSRLTCLPACLPLACSTGQVRGRNSSLVQPNSNRLPSFVHLPNGMHNFQTWGDSIAGNDISQVHTRVGVDTWRCRWNAWIPARACVPAFHGHPKC